MKVIAINGSPRKGGNTETLLKTALQPLQDAGWETELIQVGGQPVRGCIACNKCFEKKNKQCIQKDLFNDVMAKLVAADAMIFGSPTYFTDVTSELKAIIDRSGYVALANGGLFNGKIGAAVVAMRRGGATHAYDSINHMFLMNRMLIPGSTYWNIGVGRDKGEVENDTEALRNMNHLGRAIAWLGETIAPKLSSYPVP